ncbi:MAG: acetolactate synthase small subunit [Victivallaceae bacterium]|nr:acetolactate synthase small subunit [Victivallaceae bacterium]
MSKIETHTISVLVDNKFGVLARVAGLFSGRGYNIMSLTVNETQDPTRSQMTIVTAGDETVIDQIDSQLSKLIDVIKVEDLTHRNFIERELALIKIHVTDDNKKSQIIQLVEIFEGKIVTVFKDEFGIEIAGRADKIDNFVTLLADFGEIKLARSGRVALSREKEFYTDLQSKS